ncbi:Ejaculatory bulb-specific protein 3 [Eumeta japonica]|uniref:Ejaculatory bulb-specific protein 3 n=1 Tax=Eumeta variegata TaxID=151549 RepID=A0A4C1T2X1_EUMVA|nr:Ejaculatory bulb-specific protein 3 [Eumeta japonica]
MKFFAVLASVCCVVVVTYGRPATTYTDKWDHIDIEEILESQRLLKSYVDCLMDRGRCTADAKDLKETLPDAIEHDCSKCTARQKTNSEKIIRHFINKRPDLWKELSQKYDPNNVYQERYKDKIEMHKDNA